MEEALLVEECGRLAHRVEVEALEQLGEAELLALVAGPPANEREVVDHRLGENAEIAVVLDGDAVPPLGELLSALVHEHREVGKEGQRWSPERLPDEDRLRRRRKVLLAADHVRDTHPDVVDNDREDEERVAVRLHHDEVLDRGVRKLDVATDQVVDDGRSLVGDAEAQCHAGPRVEAPVAAETVVSGKIAIAGTPVDRLASAVAVVEVTRGEQLRGGVVVALAPLGLQVGTLVPADPEPVERIENACRPEGVASLPVGVLDAEHEGPAALVGEEPVVKRRTRPADVEEAGRGGSEPDPRPRRRGAHLVGEGDRVGRAGAHGLLETLTQLLCRVLVQDVEVAVIANLEDLGEDLHAQRVALTLVEIDLYVHPILLGWPLAGSA